MRGSAADSGWVGAFGIGGAAVEAGLQALLAALCAAAVMITKLARERVIYDDNLGLGAGWVRICRYDPLQTIRRAISLNCSTPMCSIRRSGRSEMP